MELKNGDILMKVLGKWLRSADSPLSALLQNERFVGVL